MAVGILETEEVAFTLVSNKKYKKKYNKVVYSSCQDTKIY